MPAKVAARLVGRLAVLPREHRHRVIRLRAHAASPCERPGRILPAAHPQIELTTSIVVPGCATALVDVGRGTGFAHTGAGKLLTHRNHHNLWIHINPLRFMSIVTALSTRCATSSPRFNPRRVTRLPSLPIRRPSLSSLAHCVIPQRSGGLCPALQQQHSSQRQAPKKLTELATLNILKGLGNL